MILYDMVIKPKPKTVGAKSCKAESVSPTEEKSLLSDYFISLSLQGDFFRLHSIRR
jgi:hypothetical protein